MPLLLLEVLLEARFVLLLDLQNGVRVWGDESRRETSPDAYERAGGRGAHLNGLLRVLLVRDGGLVLVRGGVEGLGGLVLFGDGLVERVRRLVCCLSMYVHSVGVRGAGQRGWLRDDTGTGGGASDRQTRYAP